jgi:hypothetical protein
MTITNIYLSAAEYQVLAQLPANVLRKPRYRLQHDGHVYNMDFDGRLAGLSSPSASRTVGAAPSTYPRGTVRARLGHLHHRALVGSKQHETKRRGVARGTPPMRPIETIKKREVS